MSAILPPKRDNPKLAVGVILLAVLTLAVGDALIKDVSTRLVLWQIFVLRSAVAVLVLLGILRFGFASVGLIPRALAWTIARSGLLVAMWIAYYAALPHLQLSIAAAAFYTLPIFITLFSALLVGERVTPLGWFAVALGFAGVLLILRPTASGFNAFVLLPLLSAVLYALAMILTRTKCRNEHPLILSGTLNVAFVLAGLAATAFFEIFDGTVAPGSFLSADWAPLGEREILAILMMATAILVGSIGASIAYQIARSSLVATFDFAYVGFAAICGFLFFGELPDLIALCGIAMITIAGLIAIRQ